METIQYILLASVLLCKIDRHSVIVSELSRFIVEEYKFLLECSMKYYKKVLIFMTTLLLVIHKTNGKKTDIIK